MKFGFNISRKMLDLNARDPYRRLYDFLNEMEDLGYDIAYVGHHRFADRTAMGGDVASEPSSPLVMLAALFARTQRIKLCTNVMLVPALHPLELAEQINTINELSSNRFILGGGIGYKRDEFENVGWPFKTRARRFEECIAILRMALEGREVSFHGEHFDIDSCRVVPAPLPGREPMSIWIGAVSEPAMLRAGRIGDGWLISFAEHLQELVAKVARYKEVAVEHGRPSTVCLMRDLHIAPTKARIDAQWLPNVVKVWRDYASLGAVADRDETASQALFGDREMTLEEFTPNRAIVGTPDDCARELERVRDLINPEYLLFTPTGIPDAEQQMEELRLFGREVLPHFRT